MDLSHKTFVFGALAAALVVGCYTEKPKPKSGDWMDGLKQVNPGAKPIELEDEPEEKPKIKPPPPPAPVLRKSSGRPMIQIGPSKEITDTFGATPGSVIKLKTAAGAITLRIPEFGLDGGYNIDWKTPRNPKNKGRIIGAVTLLKITPGSKAMSKAVTSGSDDFKIVVPLGKLDSFNLAVGTMTMDDQGAPSKPKWAVYAPQNVDTGLKEATFTLKTIGPMMYMHATTTDATVAAAEPVAP